MVWNGTAYVKGNRVTNTNPLGGGRARGGPLGSGVTLVGEQGPELIINGTVIPNPETRRIMGYGLRPTNAFSEGGGMGIGYTSQRNQRLTESQLNALDMAGYQNTPEGRVGRFIRSQMDSGVSSQGGSAQAAASAAVVSAAMAPQVAAAVGAAVPIAVGAMSAKQAEAIVMSNERLGNIFAREMRSLKQELARAVSSAVQKVI
jgi:hypothetical protein